MGTEEERKFMPDMTDNKMLTIQICRYCVRLQKYYVNQVHMMSKNDIIIHHYVNVWPESLVQVKFGRFLPIWMCLKKNKKLTVVYLAVLYKPACITSCHDHVCAYTNGHM